MFETLRNALKVKDIRKRLLFTLVVLIICRAVSFQYRELTLIQSASI
jgi:preprotein translocase subunit SecY